MDGLGAGVRNTPDVPRTGVNFQNDSLKAKISGLYCSPVQPQIVHMDAGRVSGSLQTYPEGDDNNQTYDLSQKGKSLR